MDDIRINDLRADDDPSLEPVPRITTWDQLQEHLPVQVRRDHGWDATPPGVACWRLKEIYIRSGVAEFISKVLDINGNPLADYIVLFHWPDAPPLPEGAWKEYFTNGVFGQTNANGDVGFPFGPGGVYVNGSGPHSIWVSPTLGKPNEPQYSDLLTNMGWHGATDHVAANPIFGWDVKPEGDQPPPATGNHYITVGIDGQVVWRADLEIVSSLRVVG